MSPGTSDVTIRMMVLEGRLFNGVSYRASQALCQATAVRKSYMFKNDLVVRRTKAPWCGSAISKFSIRPILVAPRPELGRRRNWTSFSRPRSPCQHRFGRLHPPRLHPEIVGHQMHVVRRRACRRALPDSVRFSIFAINSSFPRTPRRNRDTCRRPEDVGESAAGTGSCSQKMHMRRPHRGRRGCTISSPTVPSGRICG